MLANGWLDELRSQAKDCPRPFRHNNRTVTLFGTSDLLAGFALVSVTMRERRTDGQLWRSLELSELVDEHARCAAVQRGARQRQYLQDSRVGDSDPSDGPTGDARRRDRRGRSYTSSVSRFT
jgi:hypothetical protein